MIAIIRIGGHQALVKEKETIRVDKLSADIGTTIELETFLVSEEDGSDFSVGKPLLENIKVTAKVLEHGKDKKIRVFKMKPRKRYRRTIGHRQDFSVIEIQNIGKTAAKTKATASSDKKTTEKAEPKTAKPKAPKATTTKKTTVAKKTTTAKKVSKTTKKN